MNKKVKKYLLTEAAERNVDLATLVSLEEDSLSFEQLYNISIVLGIPIDLLTSIGNEIILDVPNWQLNKLISDENYEFIK